MSAPELDGELRDLLVDLIIAERAASDALSASPAEEERLEPDVRERLIDHLEIVLVDADMLEAHVEYTLPLLEGHRHRADVLEVVHEESSFLSNVAGRGLESLDDVSLRALALNPVALRILHAMIEEEIPAAFSPASIRAGRQLAQRHGKAPPEWLLEPGVVSPPESEVTGAAFGPDELISAVRGFEVFGDVGRAGEIEVREPGEIPLSDGHWEGESPLGLSDDETIRITLERLGMDRMRVHVECRAVSFASIEAQWFDANGAASTDAVSSVHSEFELESAVAGDVLQITIHGLKPSGPTSEATTELPASWICRIRPPN